MDPRPRKRAACAAALVLLLMSIVLPISAPGFAAPAHPVGTSPFVFPAAQQSEPPSEVADFAVVPIDPNLNGNEVLRSRPFILDWNTNPAYQIVNSGQVPMTSDEARAALADFLDLRGVDLTTRSRVLERFDDPQIVQLIAAPTLRAALLMLSDLDPYQAVVDSILDGANETALPFAAVEFTDLGISNAVATILPPSIESGPRYRMQIASRFAGEPPIHLVPVLIHESLHGDGENSATEELTANILDTIGYAELLLIDPGAAFTGTELGTYNNLQLYALLNSMGIRGGGHVGVATSVIGDVFVGPGLEDFDARSIRDSILQDPFYGSLAGHASPISPTAHALIDRFPGQTSLGDVPVFDESLLALIDRGVGHIISPDTARDLAIILGLSMTAGSLEASAALSQATILDMGERPFIPLRPELFDLNQTRRPGTVTDERSMRLALLDALKRHGQEVNRAELLALFDIEEIESRIPDAQLRAAIVLLAAVEPWSETASALLQAPSAGSWTLTFAPLPVQVNALFDRNERGMGRVLINQYLVGESLELTATAILEGILLEGDRRSPNGAVVAALMSTLAWGHLLEHNPEVSANLTWGTINRNLDLLALLNSTQWSAASGQVEAGQLGFLAPAGGASDVLSGLLADASSFQAHVLNSARAIGVENVSAAVPSELLIGLVDVSGMPLPSGPAGVVIDQTAMLLLDGRISALLPAEVIATLIHAMDLGTGA